jgi:hypothetical protein
MKTGWCCKKKKPNKQDCALKTGVSRVSPVRLSLPKQVEVLTPNHHLRKADEKKILGDSRQHIGRGFTRKVVAHRHTKGGNFYGIQVEVEDKGQNKPSNAIELVEKLMPPTDAKDFFESLKEMSPVKSIQNVHFVLPELPNKRGTTINQHNGVGSNENSPTNSFNAKHNSNENGNQNLSKPDLQSFGDLIEKQEDSNVSMSRLSSIEAKSKKQLDISNSKNESHRLEIYPMQAGPGDEYRHKKKSASVTKRPTRVTGYRTLKYKDLFSTVSKCANPQEDKGGSSKFLERSSNENKMMLSDKNLKNSGSYSGSQLSINMGADNDGINDMNRNDYSFVDITLLGKERVNDTSTSKSTKRLSHMGRAHRRQNSSKLVNDSLMPEDDEVRQNKDLNTTYVRSSELVNPKKSYKDAGIVVTGKRTKINQYVLLTSIGKGGWGEVFLAIDVDSNEKHKYVSWYEARP